MTAEEKERQEENEYLGTISNFHWFVYPFFKCVEHLCDKIFGCKRKAKELNDELFKRKQEDLADRQRLREEQKKQK